MTTTIGYPNIAFVGKAGSGKTTSAGILRQIRLPGTPAMGYEIIGFAEPARKIAAELWGTEFEYRDRMQALANALRGIDEDVMLRPWAKRVALATWPVVADDVRYENEWFAAKGRGFVTVRLEAWRLARIDRLKANGKWCADEQLDHSSESSIDHLTADYTIVNDGTKLDLAESLARILDREARRR